MIDQQLIPFGICFMVAGFFLALSYFHYTNKPKAPVQVAPGITLFVEQDEKLQLCLLVTVTSGKDDERSGVDCFVSCLYSSGESDGYSTAYASAMLASTVAPIHDKGVEQAMSEIEQMTYDILRRRNAEHS